MVFQAFDLLLELALLSYSRRDTHSLVDRKIWLDPSDMRYIYLQAMMVSWLTTYSCLYLHTVLVGMRVVYILGLGLTHLRL